MPTTYNKSQLSTFFAQGDIPQGTDYQNLIYSQVNLVETAEQDMAGPLYTTKLLTPRVSATNANITGIFSANAIAGLSTLSVLGDITTQGRVITSALSTSTGSYTTPAIITATGTALATAAQCTAVINRVQGVTDGQNTGVKLLTGRIGLAPQYVINETAVSANLWPAGSDYRINALTSGAAFALAANTSYTVIYTTSSAYWVK